MQDVLIGKYIIVNGFKLFVLVIDPPRDLYDLSALKRKNQMRSLYQTNEKISAVASIVGDNNGILEIYWNDQISGTETLRFISNLVH